MTRKNKRILGINPGTRYLGLAVFHGNELLDWRVKTFREKWTEEKAKRILEMIGEHIELYDINALAIKKLHPSRSSKNLKNLFSKIKALARRKRMKFKTYSINELEQNFLAGEKPNKRNLAEKIIREYPILFHELNKEKSRENAYFMRVIEAVALGMQIQNAIGS